ncbi:hypothetical protein BH23ACT9_BH23ACT9_09600 [soil metagenome]
MDPILAVVSALREAGVSFVVVGGVAVVLQGHPRMTVDLDIVVELEHDNLLRALEVLQGLGLVPRLPVAAAQFADEDTRRRWVQERSLTVFSMHDPVDPRREVDLFAESPLPWEELVADAEEIDVGGVVVPVASRAHLIRMKLQAGRPQDLADVEALAHLEDLDGG